MSALREARCLSWKCEICRYVPGARICTLVLGTLVDIEQNEGEVH